MEHREIKFRAWLPKLGIILNDITLYGNGQMGYDEDDFRDALPKGHILDYDFEGVFRIYIDADDEEDLEKVMSVLLGEDWIWIEKEDFEPMQYTGLHDKNGVEIYEGDIVCLNDIKAIITFNDGAFQMITSENQGKSGAIQFRLKQFEVIGNIFENKNLLK